VSDLTGRSIAIALSLVMAGVVGIGLYLSGSPATARQEALDERRIDALSNARAEVNEYWRKHHRLPPAIDSVNPIAYRAINDSVYELCAVFTYGSPARAGFEWRHPAGRHCFTLLASQRD